MSKGDLEAELLSLNKNQSLQLAGLERTRFSFVEEGSTRELEAVFAKAPALCPPEEAGAPVVLVHGTPSTLFTWSEIAFGNEQLDGLRQSRDVYMVEVMGHGLGPEYDESLSFQKCADYVAAVVRRLELPPVFLMGQSYGGEFAWRAALDAPELFAGLVLMSSAGIARRPGDWLPEEVEMRENSLADWGWLINSEERVKTALKPHYRGVPDDSAREFFLVCENASNWEGMIDLVRDENGARESELSELHLPTLLLWGEDDKGYTPDYYARRFDESLPDSRLVLIAETGHYAHEEKPGETLMEMERFFAEVEAAR